MKISLSLLPPFTLRLLGLGSGALLLFLLARLRRADILPARAVWPGIVAGGLLSIAVFNLAVAWAQLSTSTARAAVLTFTMPMMSALLARFVLGERLDGRRALALLLGGLGVAVLAWPALRAAVSGADPSALRGLVFPLTAAFGWAAGTVCLKRWPRRATASWSRPGNCRLGRCARWPACCWRASRFRCKAGASGSRGR